MTSGDIPAGESCPYSEDCAHFNQKCPTPDNLKTQTYSCWAARSWRLLDVSESVPLRNLVQRIRRLTPVQGDT